jgi:glycosyltransferase involved in cell wall biosynthesis
MRDISFTAIIRTTFTHPARLRESLEALTFQLQPCQAVVVVHADMGAFREAEGLCRSIERLSSVVLHANDTNKKSGYAINIGLEHCYSAAHEIQYLVFLDDDGMVYPFFTRVMANTFLTTEADLVCAPWNRRYAIRFDALKARRVWMDERLDSGADWHFLVTLRHHGFRLASNFSTLSADFVPDHRAQVAGLQSRIFDLEHSWSWRLSLPLRMFGSIFMDRKP